MLTLVIDMCTVLQLYMTGHCPARQQDTECLVGEPNANSRLMFALDMDRGLFWMGVSCLRAGAGRGG